MQRSGESRWSKSQFSELGGRSASFRDISFLEYGLSFFVQKSFYSGAKGLHKSLLLELGKSKKGRPIIKLLVILPLFKRCASRYRGRFHRRLFAVNWTEFLCCSSRIWLGYGDLSTAKFCLICYVMYQKIQTVQLDVFPLLTPRSHFIQEIQATS